MTSNPSLAYPAEYYYPEFIDNRPDDPLKPPPAHFSLKSSIEHGIGSTAKIPTNVTIPTTTIAAATTTPRKKPLNKTQASTNLVSDINTNQGLADTDITQTVIADPKKSLLRDPAERNIPRLIVDNNAIQQAVRTSRLHRTNLDQTNNDKRHLANGYLTNQTKFRDLTSQEKIKYIEDEQPIDDYWKKEVRIDDEGVVTIEVRF
jgi:hypothetical protein